MFFVTFASRLRASLIGKDRDETRSSDGTGTGRNPKSQFPTQVLESIRPADLRSRSLFPQLPLRKIKNNAKVVLIISDSTVNLYPLRSQNESLQRGASIPAPQPLAGLLKRIIPSQFLVHKLVIHVLRNVTDIVNRDRIARS